jgi:acyl-CoA synthetase (AMP-forming)/AMP-acid ligase II
MFPEQEILRFEGVSRSYEALQWRAARAAGALRALGVGPGDRVAVLQTNTPGVLDALLGAASLGAVFVPLNFRARAEELAGMLSVAGPRLLLAGDRYLPLARQLVGNGSVGAAVVSLDSEQGDHARLETLIEGAEALVPADVADDDLAVLMFTSGTSANAKAVMLDHGALVNFVFNTTEPADGSDRGAVLVAAPLYHIAGLTAVLAASFAGRRIVLVPQFEAGGWLSLVAAERVSHAFLVPTMLKRVLDHPSFPAADLSSLSLLSYGAAPMPLSVIRRAIAEFPAGVQFINAFGQTETTSTVTMLGPDDHRLEGTPEEVELKLRRLGSIGRPLPDAEVSIMDEEGRRLGPGHVGEIAIRTERVMRGYYGQVDATAATVHDGWLHTRDLAWMDEDGYIYLTGRKSDAIIRGGENVAPEEIEAVLESHPEVDEAAAFGVPDEEWGERIAVAVVGRTGADVNPSALIDFCHERLAGYKRPELVFVIDALPRNALGKLLRRELRARFAGDPTIGGLHGEPDR